MLRVFSRERSAPGLRLAHGGGPSSDWTIFIGMSQHELELAYLRALNEYTHEAHNTYKMSMSKDISGFTAQQAKEDAALQRYRAAQRAFINGPEE